MFRACDVAEAVARRKDRFVKRFVPNSSVVCEIIAFKFVIYIISYIMLPILVNKDVYLHLCRNISFHKHAEAKHYKTDCNK